MTHVLLALLFTLTVAAIDATFTPILEQATTPRATRRTGADPVTAEPTPADLTASHGLSGDQVRLLNHPSRAVVDWFETRVPSTPSTPPATSPASPSPGKPGAAQSNPDSPTNVSPGS
jgi:hypothetical protein